MPDDVDDDDPDDDDDDDLNPEALKPPATQSQAISFGGPVIWDRVSAVLQVAADRSLESVLRRIREELAVWVVLTRPSPREPVYYYAFRSSELKRIAADHPELLSQPMDVAVPLHESTSSGTARSERPATASGHSELTAARIVEFDAEGRVTAIGVLGDDIQEVDSPDPFGAEKPGPIAPPRWRGGVRAPPRDLLEVEIELTVSAEVAAEINVGATGLVAFQIERTSEANPLATYAHTTAGSNEPIAVSLASDDDAVEIIQHDRVTVDPPAPGERENGIFRIRGLRPGVVRLAVAFRQGGTELAVVALTVEVVEADARSGQATSKAGAQPRDMADDDKVLLTIKRTQEGGQIYYDYFLESERLELLHAPRSKPLLDRGDGPAATERAFVERIYDRVTSELRSRDDLLQLQREARALGVNLCKELFDPHVVELLWPLRHRISTIQVVSWEPYIPWELVRLQDPVSEEIDDRFLAEYGLVRTLSDVPPARFLPMDRWAYLGAVYPLGSYPEVGAELDYFTATSEDSLRGRGIPAEAIAATRDAFYDALATSEFDVLHVACHAESLHNSIERASLIIGDESNPAGAPVPIEVDTITVQAEARLKARRPLVFLNACETGRVGAMLTAWGGWPNVFLRAGAGAFVGSAWAVRDKPARTFSTSFYNALLDGKTLSEAADEARAEAKKLGDVSWLAFKVYGHPRARRLGAY
jgi:hypothetical protein